MIECVVTGQDIDAGAMIAAGGDPACGAVSSFVGTVRNSSGGERSGEVVCLEYEAYVPMAELEMRAIAGEATERFGAHNVLVRHRVGRLSIGQITVVVVVATPHRAAAFDACRYVIEELKQRVPIWKREIFDDGAEWVNARP
jgi:molybdopterin synthase catalytic subunit